MSCFMGNGQFIQVNEQILIDNNVREYVLLLSYDTYFISKLNGYFFCKTLINNHLLARNAIPRIESPWFNSIC